VRPERNPNHPGTPCLPASELRMCFHRRARSDLLTLLTLVWSMWDPRRHPDHELAKRIFTSGGPNSDASQQTFGGMLAFILKGDPDTAMKRGIKMCERLRLVTLAVSLGGTESLIQHPASMTHAMIPREKRLAGGLQDGLVRLSVGLESANDICEDIRQALDGCDGP
jgi:cystathionine beta-lyase/cystathionine gamma-synthase